MEKSRAIKLINKQLRLLEQLKNSSIDNEDFKTWHRDTEVVIEKIFRSDTRHLSEFRGISFHKTVVSFDPQRNIELTYAAFQNGIVSARAFLKSLRDEIKQFYNEAAKTEVSPDPISNIRRIFDKFFNISRQLQSRYRKRPTLTVEDEYDVQDLLHALLKLYFDDIRPEEWTPSYAGGCNRMDFLLKKEKIVIEVKKTRSGLNEREIGEELIVDTTKYKEHPDCESLICFIYDPEGQIGNSASLENDLSGLKEGLNVKVFVRPKY